MKTALKPKKKIKHKNTAAVSTPGALGNTVVRVGVIGYGYWGPNLVRNIQDLPHARVAAVCDLNLERLKPLMKKYADIRILNDVKALFGDASINAVVIATPVSTHYRLASMAMKAGKHVMIEKPIAASSAEAKKLITLSEKNKKVLMVGHTFEYHPAVLKIADILKTDQIGRLHYIDAVRVNLGRYQSDGRNVIWDLAPHDISIILHWIGRMPQRVSAWGQCFVRDGIEDVAFIRLEFPNKILAHIHVSWLAPAKIRRMTVVGSKQMLMYDDLENFEKVKIADRGADLDPKSREVRIDYRMGDIVSPHINMTEPLSSECGHFIDCILTQKRSRTDGVNGYRVVKVLEAADRSIKNGGKTFQIK